MSSVAKTIGSAFMVFLLAACSSQSISDNQSCDLSRNGWIELTDDNFHLKLLISVVPKEDRYLWSWLGSEEATELSKAQLIENLRKIEEFYPQPALILPEASNDNCTKLRALQDLIEKELNCSAGYPCGYERIYQGPTKQQ
ncbi:hypothetical protein [Parasphingorhabdus sp.]|uniref:hypothetical protein n=1 Tax=Parasphingorhabdus sp. TaxID=2709688 RepID=UPI003263EE0A